jgi:hypothetical protein
MCLGVDIQIDKHSKTQMQALEMLFNKEQALANFRLLSCALVHACERFSGAHTVLAGPATGIAPPAPACIACR